MASLRFVYALVFLTALLACSWAKYEPNWESLDSRPLPEWYDQGKVGIFLHWGVFSVPAYGSEWFWYRWKGQKLPAYAMYMQSNYRPDFTYADFAPMFKAEFYSPYRWAEIFEAAGANYVVLVTKHHEGFTNWPSNHSFNWNAMDVGPNQDLVGKLAQAVREKTKIKFGVYHSMFEWFNPIYLNDAANGYRTQDFVRQKTMPELYELVRKYKPDVVWSDGEWMASDTYWNSTHFLAWLYNESPVKDTVVVNDRWGNNTRCKHGGFWDCTDHYIPGKVVPHKWENCMTIDKYSWGYRANAKLIDIHTMDELIEQMVSTVSLGGNILFNVGPTAAGDIAPIYEERLRQIGAWLKVNGEAIYGTKLWSHQNDSVTKDAWYTAKGNGSDTVIYAILLSWPETDSLTLAFPVASSTTVVSLVGYSGPVSYKPVSGGGIAVTLPSIPASKMPCDWAWVLKLTNLKNQKTKLHWDNIAKHIQSIKMEKDIPKGMRSL